MVAKPGSLPQHCSHYIHGVYYTALPASLASQHDDQLKTNEKLAASIKNLEQQLSKAMTIPTASAAEQDAIVVSGVAESTAPADLQHFIQEIITETMDLSDVTVVAAERLGSPPTSEGVRPRKILVRLQTKQQAIATLKVAHRLKEHNSARKAAGEQQIGIDRNLSGPELKHRSLLWPAFKEAKSSGKQCRWQMGFRLFVDGSEVMPQGTA